MDNIVDRIKIYPWFLILPVGTVIELDMLIINVMLKSQFSVMAVGKRIQLGLNVVIVVQKTWKTLETEIWYLFPVNQNQRAIQAHHNQTVQA